MYATHRREQGYKHSVGGRREGGRGGRGDEMREFECTPIELRAKSFLIPRIAGGVEILSAGTR